MNAKTNLVVGAELDGRKAGSFGDVVKVEKVA